MPKLLAVGERGLRPLVGALGEIVVGGAQCLAALVASPMLRRWYDAWGATAAEVRSAVPGAELGDAPVLGFTRAITGEAPPERGWPWLVQIGHGRGGLYSYDGLENLLGCQLHSATRVLADHQHPALGDLVRLGPEGYPCFAIMRLEAPHTLVLMGADPRTGEPPQPGPPGPRDTTVTWQWQLRTVPGGRTRLVVRQRIMCPPSQRPMWRIVEPLNFVMERRMLRQLKSLAERSEPGRRSRPGNASRPSDGPT